MGICAKRDAEGASKTEIADFEVAVFVDEKILRFEIAVKDSMGVAVAYTREQLVCELLDLPE